MYLDVLYNADYNLIIITNDQANCDVINNIYNQYTIYWIVISHIYIVSNRCYNIPINASGNYPIKPLDFNIDYNKLYYDYVIKQPPQLLNNIINELVYIMDEIFHILHIDHIINGIEYINIVCSPYILFKYSIQLLHFIINNMALYDIQNLQLHNNIVNYNNVKIHDRFVISNNKYDKLLNMEISFWYNTGKSWYNKQYNATSIEQLYDIMATKQIDKYMDDTYQYVNLLHAHGHYVFGEFHDVLQRLYIIDKLNIPKHNLRLLCHSNSSVSEFEYYLTHLGYASEQIMYLDSKLTYHIPNMIHIPNLTYPTHITQHTRYWFYTKYAKQYYDPLCKYKLYLSRNSYNATKRRVNNENEIIEYLQSHGFIILTGSEPLCEIIKYFANAVMIIFPHGSLLRNNIHCGNKPYTIEFCAHNRVNYSFVHMSNIYNAPHKFNIVQADDNYNFDIDIDYIKQEVEAFEKSTQ